MSDRWYFPGQERFVEIDRLRKEAFDAQRLADEATPSELVLTYMAAVEAWEALRIKMRELWPLYRTDHPMLHEFPIASTA